MKLSTLEFREATIDLLKPMPGLAYLEWVFAQYYHDRTRLTQ
jgi:hypothetical protein